MCTAGRLVDHLKLTEGLDLKFLEFLIIDEADRVLESMQNDWLYHLEKHISAEGLYFILLYLTIINIKFVVGRISVIKISFTYIW